MKLQKNGIWPKKFHEIDLFDFTSFFRLDIFKFSDRVLARLIILPFFPPVDLFLKKTHSTTKQPKTNAFVQNGINLIRNSIRIDGKTVAKKFQIFPEVCLICLAVNSTRRFLYLGHFFMILTMSTKLKYLK